MRASALMIWITRRSSYIVIPRAARKKTQLPGQHLCKHFEAALQEKWLMVCAK
jgi:hypothetical protein